MWVCLSVCVCVCVCVCARTRVCVCVCLLKRIHAFETNCTRKLLGIFYLEHKISDWVRSKICFLWVHKNLFWQLLRDGSLHGWAYHTLRQPFEIILQSTLKGGRRRGRQSKCWVDNIKEWTSLPIPELLTRASCRKDWKRISAESSFMYPRRPNRSMD